MIYITQRGTGWAAGLPRHDKYYLLPIDRGNHKITAKGKKIIARIQSTKPIVARVCPVSLQAQHTLFTCTVGVRPLHEFSQVSALAWVAWERQGSIGGPEYSAAHQNSRDLVGDQLLHPKWKIKTNDYTNLLCMSCLFLYVRM